jgi:hypothetical protein
MSFELSDLRLAALRTAKTAMMWPNAAVKNFYRVLPLLCRNEGVGTTPGGKKPSSRQKACPFAFRPESE